MGVINATPDSFSDGGSLYRADALDLQRVLQRARDMVAAGADILDIGGESTRPGAAPVSVEQELARVLPCVTAIRAELDVPISVDTSTPQVMREAARLGAGMINDVRSLAVEGALATAVELQLPVCLVHMQGEPATMQDAPEYDNVNSVVADFLQARARACTAAGLSSALIYLDPGFGFGKSLEHNLRLLRGLPGLVRLGFPVVVGLSRKSMIGRILKRGLDRRLAAGLALAVLAAERGASIIRTHDVADTVAALAMVTALAGAGDAG